MDPQEYAVYILRLAMEKALFHMKNGKYDLAEDYLRGGLFRASSALERPADERERI